MKRGQVYFNHYRDMTGKEKRFPILVVSRDDYNKDSEFVTGVRLAKYNNAPCPQHVFLPGSAFTDTTVVMGDCYALAEMVSSVRKSSLEGPIAAVGNVILDAIGFAVEYQIGTRDAQTDAPSKESPWYSAAVSPQMRPTNPSHDQEG